MNSGQGSPPRASGNLSAIATNEIVLEKTAGECFQEVRHIVLRGTNQEIGRAIAGLSQDYYQAQCLAVRFAAAQTKQGQLHP